MALFFIAYDLFEKDEDAYSDLSEALKKLGAERVQESVWAVKSELSASEIREKLKNHFPNKSDRLLVGQIDGWSSLNSMYKISEL